MSVRMRHTRSHTNNRRSHHALSGVATVIDKESGELRLPHRLDESTGMYRGKLIAAPKVKKERTKAEKYEHSKHIENEKVAIQEDKNKVSVSETHEHRDSVQRGNRGS